MSMNDSIGNAMANAVKGAMIGQAIGSMQDEINHLNNEIAIHIQTIQIQNGYIDKRDEKIESLTRENTALRDALGQSNKINENLKDKLKEASIMLDAYEKKLKAVNKTMNFMADIGKKELVTIENTKKYIKNLHARIASAEKALRYSSADSESLSILLNFYKCIMEKYNLETDLTPEIQKQIDSVQDAYMNGEKLTDNPNIKEILDSAPMPERPLTGEVFAPMEFLKKRGETGSPKM